MITNIIVNLLYSRRRKDEKSKVNSTRQILENISYKKGNDDNEDQDDYLESNAAAAADKKKAKAALEKKKKSVHIDGGSIPIIALEIFASIASEDYATFIFL